MKIRKTKTDDQMVETESEAVSLTEDSVQVKAPEGDKVAVPLEDPEVLAVREGDLHHIGIWSDDVVLQAPEESEGRGPINLDSTARGPSSQAIYKCQNTYDHLSPAKKQSTNRPTHPCRLCVCTMAAGHTGDHKCTDCGRTWS